MSNRSLFSAVLWALAIIFLANSPGSAQEQRLRIAEQPKSIVFAATFSPGGKLLAIACYDKTIIIFDAATGQQRMTLRGHSERVWSVAFSPDGKSLASASGEYRKPTDPGEAKIWDVETGRERVALAGHQGLVFGIAYSPDGKTVASASWDSTVKFWDAATGKETGAFLAHKGPVRNIAFSPDRKIFASASFDGTVCLLDATTLQNQKTIQAHAAGTSAMAFSPAGRRFATADRPTSPEAQPELKVWDIATGAELGRFAGLASRILCVDFSPDGRMLAIGGGQFSESGEVKLVELFSGRERANLKRHKEWVECVRFSPDGRFLVSGGGFTREALGELHIWYLADLLTAKPAKESLSPDELTTQWNALADPDAAKAYQAVLTLKSAPRSAIPFLKQHLRPSVPPDPKQLAQLLSNLNSDSFPARQKAVAELLTLGDSARPALEAFAAKPPSVEASARAREVLKQVKIPISSASLLRELRAVEILEQINTKDARELLAALAAGVPEAYVTQESRTALNRSAE